MALEVPLSAYRLVPHGNSRKRTGKEIELLKSWINESDDRGHAVCINGEEN